MIGLQLFAVRALMTVLTAALLIPSMALQRLMEIESVLAIRREWQRRPR